jgi:chemotaxis protein MotB
MAKKHKCPECPPPGAPPWMATYADMVTLLLTFFVLLLSFATMEQVKFNVAMTSLRGALGVLNSRQGVSVPVSNMPQFQIGRGRLDQVVEQMVQQIQSELRQMNLADLLQVNQTRDRLHFTLSEPLLFESGRAEVRQEADEILSVIAEIINMIPFEVRVEGHTDNIPIRTARFPSNWELSFGRGLALTQKFMEFGVNPSRFQVIGYGEHRPLAENTTAQGRAINRRVEVIINLRDEVRRSILPDD